MILTLGAGSISQLPTMELARLEEMGIGSGG
jgi:hypothetical protein